MWGRPLFSELNSSFRRRKTRIVAHDFGVVRRVKLVEAGVRAAMHTWLKTMCPVWIPLQRPDCSMVELVAVQSFTIIQDSRFKRLRLFFASHRSATKQS